MDAAVNCLLIEPMLYRIDEAAGVLVSSLAVPYAFRYAICPSFTTATDALGTPDVAKLSAAILSIFAAISGDSVFCASIERKTHKENRKKMIAEKTRIEVRR